MDKIGDLINKNVMEMLLTLGIKNDMPIMMDYWMESKKGKVIIGLKDNEKILVKNEEEYTSPIKNIYKSDDHLIILTENSIYLVYNNIKAKHIKTN